MIRLEKGPLPPVLAANASAWTDEYMQYVRDGDDIPGSVVSRYKHPEIKAAIRAETNEKCVYCESKVRHVYPGDVEHILPRARMPALVFEWNNLTFACWKCNNAKRDYYDPEVPLINPYEDIPEDHILFIGPQVCNIPGDHRGRQSILVLKLNRIDLFMQRVQKIETLERLVDNWKRMPEGRPKALLRTEIITLAGEDQEYSAAANSYLCVVGF